MFGLPVTVLRVGEITRIVLPHHMRAERLIFNIGCATTLLAAYDAEGGRVEHLRESPWSYRFAPHHAPVRTLLVAATAAGTVVGGMFGSELN